MLSHKLNRCASTPGPVMINSAEEADPNHASKRRKTAPASTLSSSLDGLTNKSDDTIDPVQKLLSLTSLDEDILLRMDDDDDSLNYASPSSYSSICSDGNSSSSYQTPAIPYSAAHYNISCNFNKVINENLRSYYSTFRKSQMEIHNDHSLFSVLTRPRKSVTHQIRRLNFLRSKQVPFFKNVNFNPSPDFGSRLEDYIDYKDDNDIELTGASEENSSEVTTPLTSPIPAYSGRMSFHYRRQDGLNLSLTDDDTRYGLNDGLRFLNPRSIISGLASETIGAAKFMIHDFFF